MKAFSLNNRFATLIIIQLFTLSSCSYQTADDKIHKIRNDSITLLEAQAAALNTTDPDSAEKIILQLITIYDSIGNYRGVIDKYSGLSELYQYRKHDDIAALQALTNAFLVSARHPEEKLDNPYLFIDGGNLLFRNGLFEQAIEIYRETYNMALKSEAFHPKQLAINNIGLSYTELAKHDSALKYYKLSQELIPDSNDLLQAQTRIMQSEELIKLKRFNETEPLLRHASQVLRTYQTDSLDHKIIESEQFRAMYYKLMARKAAVQARVEQYAQQHERVNKLFGNTLQLAEKSGNLLFKGSLLLEMMQKPPLLPENLMPYYADTLMLIARQANNSALQLKTALLMYTVYMDKKDQTQALLWKQKADEIRNEAEGFSDETRFHENLIQSSSILLLSLSSTRESRDNYRLTTHRQALLILLLLALLVGAGAALVLKGKLRKTNLRLAERTSQVIRLELSDTNADSKAYYRNTRLVEQFESLMEELNYYTHKEITLAEIAALLKTNQTYLSQAINQHYGINFKEVINQLRVKTACRLLMSDFSSKYTMESLAGEVGFNSTSAFYSSFKKYTGVSPVEYRRINIPITKMASGT